MKKMVFYCDICGRECKETFDAHILEKTITTAEWEMYGNYKSVWKDLCKNCADKLAHIHEEFINWGEQQ